MNFSSFFIQRPRFSGVIAVVMVLVGLIALALLPISQYPQITPPQIIVSASYPGAGAEEARGASQGRKRAEYFSFPCFSRRKP